ncbi:hypothetical protein F2Q70_00022070 [Brassica cretica]|uniref:Uncharacterized protein n=2 Tax=Brassica cretica TaxID=69181 RepID=A0A8S9HD98_BRACR|nr:hypothetical protein F2Q70_00022070 [Brassica cretica]KAF2556485.1 hypothetical protein F2Q68_00015873 [Brassica cretica]KAF3609150.1 hypothetical protein DY000_02048423 [Brassica cretica]
MRNDEGIWYEVCLEEFGMYRPYRSGSTKPQPNSTKDYSGENVTLKELHPVLTLELMTVEGIKSAWTGWIRLFGFMRCRHGAVMYATRRMICIITPLRAINILHPKEKLQDLSSRLMSPNLKKDSGC